MHMKITGRHFAHALERFRFYIIIEYDVQKSSKHNLLCENTYHHSALV